MKINYIFFSVCLLTLGSCKPAATTESDTASRAFIDGVDQQLGSIGVYINRNTVFKSGELFSSHIKDKNFTQWTGDRTIQRVGPTNDDTEGGVKNWELMPDIMENQLSLKIKVYKNYVLKGLLPNEIIISGRAQIIEPKSCARGLKKIKLINSTVVCASSSSNIMIVHLKMTTSGLMNSVKNLFGRNQEISAKVSWTSNILKELPNDTNCSRRHNPKNTTEEKTQSIDTDTAEFLKGECLKQFKYGQRFAETFKKNKLPISTTRLIKYLHAHKDYAPKAKSNPASAPEETKKNKTHSTPINNNNTNQFEDVAP